MTIPRLPKWSVECGAVLLFAVLISPVSAQSPAPPVANKPLSRVHAKLDGFDISAKGQNINQAGAASRGRSAPKLYAPILGKTYTLRPQFHWQAEDPEAKVTFHLMTPDGQTVFETAASGGHLDYPASAPALSPGSTYRWTVIPADDDLFGELPVPVSFVVVSGAERVAIATELASTKDPAAMASVYVSHRVWYDSIQAYSALLDHTPGDENARAARAQLYDQLPVTQRLSDSDWAMIH